MTGILRGGIVLLATFSCLETVHGGLIGLGSGRPDVKSSFSSINYDASSGLLTMSGFPANIDFDGVAPPDHNIINDGASIRNFSIQIHVNGTGALVGGVTGNDLAITGLIDYDNSNSKTGSETFATLLTGEIAQFGYQDVSPYRLFEFVFHVSGGTLASYFPSDIGVIYDAVSYPTSTKFTGSFGSNFGNTSASGSYSDTFPVPEPATITLLALAGFGLLARGRARRVTGR